MLTSPAYLIPSGETGDGGTMNPPNCSEEIGKKLSDLGCIALVIHVLAYNGKIFGRVLNVKGVEDSICDVPNKILTLGRQGALLFEFRLMERAAAGP